MRRISGHPSSHGGDGVLGVTSQMAWQKDLNISRHLPPIVDNRQHDDDVDRSDQGEASTSQPFPQRCNRVLPLDDDVTDDAGRHERRHHKRGRKKCRRHRHEQQQQTLFNSDSPTGGQQSADT